MTTVEFLLLNGAKVDIRDNNGQGPLHHATQLGHTGYVVSLIMAYGLEMLEKFLLQLCETDSVS